MIEHLEDENKEALGADHDGKDPLWSGVRVLEHSQPKNPRQTKDNTQADGGQQSLSVRFCFVHVRFRNLTSGELTPDQSEDDGVDNEYDNHWYHQGQEEGHTVLHPAAVKTEENGMAESDE